MALPQEHSRVHDRAIVGVLTRRWRMNSLSFHTSVPSNQPLATASQLCFIFMVSLPHHRSWNHACLPDIDVMLTYMPDSQSATNTCVFFCFVEISWLREISRMSFFPRTHRQLRSFFPSLWQRLLVQLRDGFWNRSLPCTPSYRIAG
jgi:hypothetical protein